ncbi:MAG: NnrS family protein [Gammaproteobacteria bacterium]
MKIAAILNMPLFALGFRVFFLIAGLAAMGLMLIWGGLYGGWFKIDSYYSGMLWHAHEMLVGYAAAVIAGFLLTAVRNWTGKPTPVNGKLAALAVLWLLGRLLPLFTPAVPGILAAAVDWAFLPVLAWQIGSPIVRARHFKSLVFSVLLLLMAAGNGLIHAEVLGFFPETSGTGVKIIVMTIILMILVIAGRVFPFFTERGLPGAKPRRNTVADTLAVASALLVFTVDLSAIAGKLLAFSAVAAAIFNLARLIGWYDSRIWRVPLLWVLYTGYAWIVAGFVLTALSAYSMVIPSLALHAFTIGGIGVLTLGMMSRVALGHTGRELKASMATAAGFVLINLAVLVRVAAPLVLPTWYADSVYLAMVLWLTAFALFLGVNAPMLVRPRPDGRPG